jgi:hypothetical protein
MMTESLEDEWNKTDPVEAACLGEAQQVGGCVSAVGGTAAARDFLITTAGRMAPLGAIVVGSNDAGMEKEK